MKLHNTNRILLSPDAAEPAIVDPLAIPAGSLAEPSFPVLSEGPKRMLVQDLEVASGDNGENKRLVITLALTKPDKSTEGMVLQPGFASQVSVFLTPNERTSAKQIAEQAAMVVKAALGEATKVSVAECLANKALIVGKPVDVIMGVRKSKDSDKEYSNVKKWIVPAAKK